MKTTILALAVVFFGVVSIADGATVVAVSNSGEILQSTDAGENWLMRSSGTSVTLLDVECKSDGNCWAVGDSGTIIHSADGGTTWSSQTSGTSGNLRDVIFVDSQVGWAVGDRTDISETILHTVDGGNTWTPQSIITASNSFQGVDFVDDNIGWVVSVNGEIHHTVDGGISWSSQTSGLSSKILAVDFVDTDKGWFVGAAVSSAIGRTVNGGTTWTTQAVLSPMLWIGLDFVDDVNGWVVGDVGTVIHTIDGGSFWSNMQAAVSFRTDVLSGVVKSLVFGFVITWIAVYQGFAATPTAAGIAKATTKTVVYSSLAVLGLDFVLTAVMLGGW